MAHIVRFKVAGLAGRPDAYQQELRRHVNVFFGPNGSGKTSLLRVFHSAFANDLAILSRTPVSSADVTIHSIALEGEFTRRFSRAASAAVTDETSATEGVQTDLWRATRRALGVGQKPQEAPWQDQYPRKKSKTMGSLSHVYLPTSRLYSSLPGIRTTSGSLYSDYISGSPLEEDQLDEMFATMLERRWRDYTASVLGDVQRAQARGLTRILQSFLSAAPAPRARKSSMSPTDLAPAYEGVRSFLARQGAQESLGSLDDFSKRYERDTRLQQVVDDIEQVERSIAEAMAPRVRLKTLVADLFSGPKVLQFSDSGITVTLPDGKSIALATLSSGEKHLLRILVDVMSAGANSVMIDEPEISMHVDWQSSFIELVHSLNPDCQLVLATHSPEIVANLPDSDLFRL